VTIHWLAQGREGRVSDDIQSYQFDVCLSVVRIPITVYDNVTELAF
jgi:hypothetical protein